MSNAELLLSEVVDREKLNQLIQKNIINGPDMYRIAVDIGQKILEACFNKGYSVPVDIRKVVEKFGVGIVEADLNVDTGFQLDYVYGYLWRTGKGRWIINVDEKQSEYAKHYIIAHEFSHYVLRQGIEPDGAVGKEEGCLGETESYIDPFFPRKWDELLCDMLGAYLLFPPQEVLAYMKAYADNMQKINCYPMDGYEWLRELGQKAQVSAYYTIVSYQYLRSYMCAWYQSASDNIPPEYMAFFK